MNSSESFDEFDPLALTSATDPGLFLGAQRREIKNILRSYVGYYDLFAELIQNALDAIEKRSSEDKQFTQGRVCIEINLNTNTVCVTDNGCGMSIGEIRQFLRPNFSFKSGLIARGNKGVGATYLGYGFNELTISSKKDGQQRSGRISGGRNWVEDTTETVERPKLAPCAAHTGAFEEIDVGTAVSVKLVGDNIRPRNLLWYNANKAFQWIYLLRIWTSIGGVYLSEARAPNISAHITVVDQNGDKTEEVLEGPEYLYPHLIVKRCANLDDFIKDQNSRASRGIDLSRVPPKFLKLNGLWGSWNCAELLREVESRCPINLTLDADERNLTSEANVSIYIFLAFSTELWDSINDRTFGLRKGARVLRGGLQLATRHMPQGSVLTIPMTNNIGFQNLAHVVLHFGNAEPDLGRKGFQPEYTHLAEKIAVSAVTAFRRRYNLLRKPGNAKIFSDELKIEQWIRDQEEHEREHSLRISGKGLFMPTEELPIRSEPLVEQDVVALFNQMLSSGLVRGIQLISSSQYNQYDGLYRVKMAQPYDKFILSDENPLGIDLEFFSEEKDKYESLVKVLEYKYNMDGLIEEIQSGVKDVNDIGLVVCWEIGEKWREIFDGTCLLDEETVHLRQIHGTTHSFMHSVSGVHAFEVIVLHDLIRYLNDPLSEVRRQRVVMELE